MRRVMTTLPVQVLGRAALPMGALCLCAVMLAQVVTSEHLMSLPTRLREIATWQWMVATLCTVASFWAVAQYDVLAHKALGTGISPFRARISGAVGIALGQTLGFGVVSGALARWRMLADLTLAQAAKLSGFVGVSFVVCWAVLTALACLLLPAPEWTRWPAWAVCLGLPFVAVFMFLRPTIRLLGHTLHLPSLRISMSILFWALLDTALASAALFVLLPSDSIGFMAFIPLFLMALGCGLISNTPGGVGPFELVLIAAAPVGDPGAIMAAILGYRIIYYALPAICAGLALLCPFGHCTSVGWQRPVPDAPRSEVAVVTQNGGGLVCQDNSTLALWPTGQTATLFADPVSGSLKSGLSHLCRTAHDLGKWPVIYKCGAGLAATARSGGWRVLLIAHEAVLDLAAYDLALPARRSLRRKLRAAEKGGVVVRADRPLPFAAMAAIDARWQTVNGTARGGSMGRYSPDYVNRQWVGCAYVHGRLVGFITAHYGQDEWCLDIMRHLGDMPDGTMHALVDAAIRAAHRAGAKRFSLAAVPACPKPQSALWRWASVQIASRAGGSGLRQFKSSFVPYWVPRYAAAQSSLTLLLGLADITRAIHHPSPLDAAPLSSPHNVDEDNELDSPRAA